MIHYSNLLRFLLCIIALTTLILELATRHDIHESSSLYQVQSVLTLVACTIHLVSLTVMLYFAQWPRIRSLLLGSFNILCISTSVIIRAQFELFHYSGLYNVTSILLLILMVAWLPVTFLYPPVKPTHAATFTLAQLERKMAPPPYRETSHSNIN